jgi:hypothetical protein
VEEILETNNNNNVNKHVFETHNNDNNNVKGNKNRSVTKINNSSMKGCNKRREQ